MLNDPAPAREGDCECDGVSEGACASVAMAARYWMTFLVLSVLPAPDSPLLADLNERCEEVHGDLRDQDTLVLPLLAHVHPRAFGDCEYVGWVLITTLVSVLVYNGVRVER